MNYITVPKLIGECHHEIMLLIRTCVYNAMQAPLLPLLLSSRSCKYALECWHAPGSFGSEAHSRKRRDAVATAAPDFGKPARMKILTRFPFAGWSAQVCESFLFPCEFDGLHH